MNTTNEPTRGTQAFAGFFTLAVFGYIAYEIYDWTSDDDTPPQPTLVAERAPAVAPQPEIDPMAIFGDANSFLGAVERIQPLFDDHIDSGPSYPAVMLARFGLERLSYGAIWRELESIDDNRRVDVMKDPEPYRGKKLCSRGTITQIATDRSLGDPVYLGVLDVGIVDIIRFVAFGSSEGLVDGSPARFCGIVIGRHSYPNRIGGQVTGIQVVGMFDLPENR